MNFKVKRISNGKSEDITAKIGSITWSDSLDSLGMEISFSVPFSVWDKNFDRLYKVGDIIVVYCEGKEVFRGLVTDLPINGETYCGFDFAFYLNKSETIIQFKKISADKAIKKLLDKYKVPVGNIPKMSASISKLYKDQYISDIIKDILKQVKSENGKSYRMEMRKGKLHIVETGYTQLKPTYIDEFGRKVSCTKVAEISGTTTMQELKNEVIVAGNDEKKKQIKATTRSSDSIKRFGLLSLVETVENLTEAKARNKAKNLLKEHNKLQVSFTATMPGNINIRAGRKLYFNFPEAGVKGWHKVKACTHSIDNGNYTVSCEMEK